MESYVFHDWIMLGGHLDFVANRVFFLRNLKKKSYK